MNVPAERTYFFSAVHADGPRVVGISEPFQLVNLFVQSSEVKHSEAEICPYIINISYL